jgi:hypothetical protein
MSKEMRDALDHNIGIGTAVFLAIFAVVILAVTFVGLCKEYNKTIISCESCKHTMKYKEFIDISKSRMCIKCKHMLVSDT